MDFHIQYTLSSQKNLLSYTYPIKLDLQTIKFSGNKYNNFDEL